MAALNYVGKQADYVYDQSLTLDTVDHEDHTFCGIMWNISCKEGAPITTLNVTSIAVRGSLGDVSVYATNDPNTPYDRVSTKPDKWSCHYTGHLPPSWRSYTTIQLDLPVEMCRGETRGFYVHSTDPGDSSIVYDNYSTYRSRTMEDEHIGVKRGMAHLGIIPFSNVSQYGWGTWRNNREFVGRINYGTRQILWRKDVHVEFPEVWRTGAATFYMMNALSFQGLPADVVEYILNMCGWSWFKEGKRRNSVVGNLLGKAKERAKSFVAVPKLTAAESGSSSVSVNSDEFSREFRAQGYHRNSISCLLM